jgi:hypothetical protein
MGKRRILLDTRTVKAVDGGITQRFWSAEKHGGPVLEGDRPWERWGVSLFGNVHYDQGRYRMWYMAWPEAPPGGNSSFVAYAESHDGIHWEKPELGIEPFEGNRDTNLLNLVRTVPSIIIEPDNSDPGHRYRAAGYIGAPRVLKERGRQYPGTGFYKAHSADGLHWTEYPADGPIGTVHDVGTFIRDAPRQCYVGTAKQMIRYDLLDRRSVSVILSDDFQQWTRPKTILVPDALDDRVARERGLHHAEFYGMGMEAYDDFLVGFLWVYWASLPLRPGYQYGMWGQMDCQLVYSYDGEYWHRTPTRQPFIPLGQRGDFDGNQLYTATRPVVMGDEVWLYYTGDVHEHAFYYDKAWQQRTDIDWRRNGYFKESSISVAKIKRDRYASLSTCGQGSITIAHGLPDGARLLVNARAPAGSVKAQILDDTGAPLAGFGLADCLGFIGDSLNGEITWAGQTLDTLRPDCDIRIQFVLDDADLFAYELETMP